MSGQYEEAEGITAEMVRGYLTWTGWERKQVYWQKSDGTIFDSEVDSEVDTDTTSPQGLRAICHVEQCTPQSILREINPRMRNGWPTDEALAAHPGDWLLRFPDVDMIIAWAPKTIRERSARVPDANVEHWPIDGRGNKVPYDFPAKATP